MTATPADVARYTQDGFVLTAEDPAIKAAFGDAQDGGDREIEMFFDTVADAQLMLDERFALLSQASPIHEGIEVEESLGLGSDIPIAPVVPAVTVVDDTRAINTVARVRAYAYSGDTDRYSVEVLE